MLFYTDELMGLQGETPLRVLFDVFHTGLSNGFIALGIARVAGLEE